MLTSSDCEAVFDTPVLAALKAELLQIAALFRSLPPIAPTKAFGHNRHLWVRASCLHECFHNVDGENLIDALMDFCDRGTVDEAALIYQ
jgi:hypothetical protein